MTYDLILALAGFAFVSSITPGPNNLMLMASGANYGLRRSLPHMIGVSIGHSFLILCVGLGLSQAFKAIPELRLALKLFAGVYMLWLAWKIANAAPVSGKQATGKPMTFLQAAAFQWVNPKGWAMALTAITVYAGDGGVRQVITVVLVFFAMNLPSISTWAVMGTQIARILHNPRHMQVFNWTMAALLLASLWPILAA